MPEQDRGRIKPNNSFFLVQRFDYFRGYGVDALESWPSCRTLEGIALGSFSG